VLMGNSDFFFFTFLPFFVTQKKNFKVRASTDQKSWIRACTLQVKNKHQASLYVDNCITSIFFTPYRFGLFGEESYQRRRHGSYIFLDAVLDLSVFSLMFFCLNPSITFLNHNYIGTLYC